MIIFISFPTQENFVCRNHPNDTNQTELNRTDPIRESMLGTQEIEPKQQRFGSERWNSPENSKMTHDTLAASMLGYCGLTP